MIGQRVYCAGMLLTQNSEMRRDGIWNWTLPAWVVQLPDGSNMNVCPNAGACAKFCYARNGTYLFPQVRNKHMSNLLLVRDNPDWIDVMAGELEGKKFQPKGTVRDIPGLFHVEHLNPWVQQWIAFGGQAVRIHDSGDFFNTNYLYEWLRLADKFSEILFYAYSKEVTMLEEARPDLPPNFQIIYSMGGKQDHLVDKETMRHADVFPDVQAIEDAGYMSQDESDLLCVLLPTTKVGIPQNNIKHFKKRLDGRTFSQAQRDRKRRDSRD